MFDLIRRDETVILERDAGRCVFQDHFAVVDGGKARALYAHHEKGGVLSSEPHARGTEEFVTVITGKAHWR